MAGHGGPAIGLALGGGGARGLAHILALEAFDELGLRPAAVSGTSIGAIFGAAHAAGLTAAEIRAAAMDLLGRRRDILRRLVAAPLESWRELWTLRVPFATPLMNPEALLGLVLPEALPDRFEDLRTPLTVVATDYYAQGPLALRAGPLRPAVAASIALPALFAPVTVDGRVLVDGGMTDPLPFDRIEPAVDLTVAIDVIGGPLAGARLKPPSPLETFISASQIMQNSIVTEKLRTSRPDVLLRPPVHRFRVLEFHRIVEILEAALPLKDELKRALDAALSAAPRRTP